MPVMAHNSRICGQPGQQSGIPQKKSRIIDNSLYNIDSCLYLPMLIPQLASLPVDYHRIEIVALLHTREYPSDYPGLAFRSLRKNVIPSGRTVFHQRVHQQLLLIFCYRLCHTIPYLTVISQFASPPMFNCHAQTVPVT